SYKVNDKHVNLFFRDHNLSDAIGFVYSGRPEKQAVKSFIDQILGIRKKLIQTNGADYLEQNVVSIILDGENCWEYYPNDGKDFITLLFKELSNHELIETVRYSEFIDRHQQSIEQLNHIHPGSWINHNFKIWIGADEDNKAWDLLAQTRNFLEKEENEGIHSEEVIKEAWEEIYIAEGSDWNWWYGDEHSSEMDMEFDKLYRSHLIRVYQLLNFDVPGELFQTIKRKHFFTFEMKYPQNLINPSIDGERTNFYEWNGAAVYDCCQTQLQSTMHQVSKIMDKIHIGFNKENIYFRIDFNQKPSIVAEYVINILTPQKTTLVFSPLKQIGEAFWWEDEKNNKKVITKNVKFKEILEIGFPFEEIGLKKGDKIGFQIQVKQGGHILEQFPTISLVELFLPDEDYESIEWFV
ncbi:MAG: hypothetical protein KAR38_14750, partial [Calditrichia bacterium]|nr:hypothetical protein [Calditrichia bacterium]